MTLWKAIVLGLVQGLTEFLPVSSSGHLVLCKQFLHIDLESGGLFFDVMLHCGTLLAIVVAFWTDIRHLAVECVHIIGDVLTNTGRGVCNLFHSKRDKKPYHKIIRSSYRKFVLLIMVSTFSTGVVALCIKDIVEQVNGTVIVTAVCLLITSVFLIIADLTEAGTKKPKDASFMDALGIGMTQGIATLPGLSRSGTTITAALLCGFDKKFALKYSFIMSVPAVLGAMVLECLDFNTTALAQTDVVSCVAATLVAAVSGYVSVCFMMRLIRGKPFRYFAIYCALAGAVSLMTGI